MTSGSSPPLGGRAIETRKIILRLLLGALALAAAAGVLAAMLPSRWFVLRVSGTGVVTAVAAGLALPASMLLVRERTRPAGLLAMVLITVEFLLALAVMWLDSWFSSRVEERIGITMAMVALCGIGLFIALLLLPVARSRLAGIAGAVTAGVAFAAFMIATWIPPTGSIYTHDEWWGTGWTLGGCGLLAAATLFGVPPGRWVSWRWAAVVFTGIVAAVILLEIWTLALSENLLSVLVSISIVLAYANLCLEMPLKPGQRWLAWAAIAAAAGTAVFIDLIIVINDSSATELLGRLAAAGGIVTGCATMAMVVLLAFNRRTELPARAAGLVEMTAVCPRCRRKQQLPIGDAACSACGLKISIRIEEPCCPECGYLLYQLTSDRCPECGRSLET